MLTNIVLFGYTVNKQAWSQSEHYLKFEIDENVTVPETESILHRIILLSPSRKPSLFSDQSQIYNCNTLLLCILPIYLLNCVLLFDLPYKT